MTTHILQAVVFLFIVTISDAIFFDSDVDCQVTHWTEWSQPDNKGQKVRTCRVLRLPVGQGKLCPPTKEIRDDGCNCTTWSVWSSVFGFGQRSRTRKWTGGFRRGSLAVSASSLCIPNTEEDIRFAGDILTMESTAFFFQTLLIQSAYSSILSSSSPPPPSYEPAKKVRDIVLIVDSSGSVGRANFETAKAEIGRLFQLLCPTDGPFDSAFGDYQYHQASMITFSSRAEENFRFNSYDSTADIIEAISEVSYIGGWTNTSGAFRTAEDMFQSYRGARSNLNKVKREVLILTDGLSNRGGDAVAAAEALSEVAQVYGIMIGSFSADGMEELSKYVSKPASEHLFHLKEFRTLTKLLNVVEAAKNYANANDAPFCAPLEIRD